MFVVVASAPPSPMSSVVYHKDQSSDRFYSSFTLQNWLKLLQNMGFHLINMPMTVKFMVLVWLSTHPHCRQIYHRFRLPALSSILFLSSATLESSLILTSVHPLMFVGLCRAVSPLFVNFVISAATSPTTVSGHWSCRSFTRDLITATLSWSGHQPTSSDDYSRFSTRLLGLYSDFDDTTTFPMH
jgi:hypothetical protein